MIVPMNRLTGAGDSSSTSSPANTVTSVVEEVDGQAAFQPDLVDEDPLNSGVSAMEVIDLD